MVRRILVTPGEPAGIGPDVVLDMASQAWPVELVVVADPALLAQRAALLGIPVEIVSVDLSKIPTCHEPMRLKVYPVPLSVACVPGTLNPANAKYVINTLEQATALCLEGRADAVVTGPVQKSVMNEAGIAFSGHTEFFAQQAGVDKTVMLFVVDQLKIALVTTHLPLSAVPTSITKELLQSTVKVLASGLKQFFGVTEPRILVCGLNPHAGENGHLGKEEIVTIAPALDELRLEGFNVIGPLPADSVFTPHYLDQADVILAMYHDQALPMVKNLGFNRAVNVTLGLPFVRTSVDHGTALTLAGSGKADAGSMRAAVELAVKLCSYRANPNGTLFLETYS